MANIRKRVAASGEVSWQVSIRKAGKTVYKTFKLKKHADAFARQGENQIDEGQYLPMEEARRHTLAESIDRYIKTVIPRKKSSTQVTDSERLRWLRRNHGHMRLDQITRAWAIEIRDGLTCGPKTKNDYIALLSHVLTIARDEWEWLRHNPLTGLKRLPIPAGRIRFLSPDERHRLLQACAESESEWLYPIVYLALDAGARKGEILGLHRQDVVNLS